MTGFAMHGAIHGAPGRLGWTNRCHITSSRLALPRVAWRLHVISRHDAPRDLTSPVVTPCQVMPHNVTSCRCVRGWRVTSRRTRPRHVMSWHELRSQRVASPHVTSLQTMSGHALLCHAVRVAEVTSHRAVARCDASRLVTTPRRWHCISIDIFETHRPRV